MLLTFRFQISKHQSINRETHELLGPQLKAFFHHEFEINVRIFLKKRANLSVFFLLTISQIFVSHVA